jgi:hypothetical protein
VFAAVLTATVTPPAAAADDPKNGPAVAHMVFFTLKDHSKESRETFMASCRKYLTEHEGTRHFGLGTMAEDSDEPVSVKDWDVSVVIVFENKAAKDKYLVNPRHKQFAQENGSNFEKVRVFDSYLVQP